MDGKTRGHVTSTCPRFAVHAATGDCILGLRVRAGASREGLVGVHDGRLKLAVRTAPEKGKANKAVLALLARSLGVPAAALELVRGETSSDKQVRVSGVSADELARRIRVALGASA